MKGHVPNFYNDITCEASCAEPVFIFTNQILKPQAENESPC